MAVELVPLHTTHVPFTYAMDAPTVVLAGAAIGKDAVAIPVHVTGAADWVLYARVLVPLPSATHVPPPNATAFAAVVNVVFPSPVHVMGVACVL